MSSGKTRSFSQLEDDHPEPSIPMPRSSRPRLDRNYNIPATAPPPVNGVDNGEPQQHLFDNPPPDLNLSLFLHSSSPLQQPPVASPPPPPPQQPLSPLQQPPVASPPPPPAKQPLFHHQPSNNPLQLPANHLIYVAPEPPTPAAPPQPQPQSVPAPASRRPRRTTQNPREGKSETIPVAFPWATNHRATVQSLKDLLDNGISSISGDVQCKRCERQFQIEFDLKERFYEIAHYIAHNKYTFRDRAPPVWMNPTLPACKFCDQENSVKPVISDKKKSINWLFLLLGQMLGCCTLEQLKYFCKHTKNHRTGAKDRVLFLTYLGLCKQLDPTGPFERE